MSPKSSAIAAHAQDFPNGSGAAALLAAGIGSFMMGVIAVAADKSAAIKSMMIFYKPTGPLSGVTTCAILVWLLSWGILEMVWGKRFVSLKSVSRAALILLALGLLLTFPPIADLL